VCHCHLVEVDAAPELLEGPPQPAAPREGVKGHSVALLKVPPYSLGFDAERAEVRVADAALGRALHARDQIGRPRRVRAGQLERAAALARAKSGEHRRLHRREVLDVPRQRLSRRAGWPAEDAGRPDPEVEHAVVRRVAPPERRVHLRDRRETRGQ
jgi:hypothetical protein